MDKPKLIAWFKSSLWNFVIGILFFAWGIDVLIDGKTAAPGPANIVDLGIYAWPVGLTMIAFSLYAILMELPRTIRYWLSSGDEDQRKKK